MTSYPRSEGELLFLTDSAYLSLIDEETESTRLSTGRQKHDGLFLERLDSFVEGQLRDMAAFADREQRSLDEIRKLVAIPHAKFLFSSQTDAINNNPGPQTIRSTLARLSSTLQTLHSIAGLDSFLLVVAPAAASSSAVTPAEASWIGGTELGKDFWMDLKGGGVAGVRAFRAKCSTNQASALVSPHPRSADIKTELNAAMRHALRIASGNPSAEMRWTRPEALEDAYDVRLHGWPVGIMRRNPSNNTMRENRHLLECIRNGSMRFVSRGSMEWDEAVFGLETGPKRQESLGAGESQAGDQMQVSISPVASMSSPSTGIASPSMTSHATTSHTTATALHPAYVESTKRPAEPGDAQSRHTRRRTDADAR